jgi:hypothetical protein
MGKGFNLEELKQILGDDSLHIGVGKIMQLEVASDRSVLRCIVLLLPDNIKMVARLTWDAVGPDAGVFQFPSINDLVLVGFVNGNEQEAFVLRRLTSKEDKIPVQALAGHTVVKALAGKKNFINSDTEINLTREGPGNERLVLGDTFKTAYSEHLGIDEIHTHIGNLGYPTFPPDQAAQYAAIKASPVDDALMLSDLSKTEK